MFPLKNPARPTAAARLGTTLASFIGTCTYPPSRLTAKSMPVRSGSEPVRMDVVDGRVQFDVANTRS
jgi:hypothetical protein